MTFRIARLLLPLSVVAVALTPAAANAGVVVGISDQNSTTFASPLYAPTKFKAARYIVPFDVMTDRRQLGLLTDWINAAKAANQQTLLSFEHSRKSRNAAAKRPSAAQYKKALIAVRKRFGSQIDEVSPWNEVNRKFDRRRGEGQPIWNRPDLAATYYGVALKVFKGKPIVALDILDENKVGPSVMYVTKFNAAVAKQRLPKPKIWGIHPYSDVNRFSTSRTKALLRATRTGAVWLTEASGLVNFGSNFPYDENRAARANKCMFTITKSNKRIKRLYFYGWVAGGSFDAAIVGTDGKPRPGYKVVQKRQAGPCGR